MSLLPWVACGILGWGIVLVVMPWLIKTCGSRCRPPDLHHRAQAAVSRFGGLGITVAYVGIEVFILCFWAGGNEWNTKRLVTAVAPLAMFGLGFWDDLKPLGATRKLTAQVLIALSVSLNGVGISCLQMPSLQAVMSPEALQTILTVIWLVTCTNLINLVDGVDGLAGTISLLLMALMVWLSQGPFNCLAAGMTGALLAFLCFNRAPARIYLGDGGAYFLGFQVGLFSMLAAEGRSNAAILTVTLFGLALPLLDTLFAVARRRLRGLPVFRPDRNHLHHYLLQTGMPPRRLVLWYSSLTLLFLSLALMMAFCPYCLSGPISLSLGLMLLFALWQLKRKLGGWNTLKRSFSASLAMRREIAYALCLRSWLRHEAERCSSVEELYAHLRSAARRLGFSSVRLSLADGSRVWQQPIVCGPLFSISHSLQGGTLGVLELQAPRCRLNFGPNGPPLAGNRRYSSTCRPLLKDPTLIRILSELLAESWVEATNTWALGKAQLRFDQVLPRASGARKRCQNAKAHSTLTRNRAEQPKKNGLFAAHPGGFLRRACGVVLWTMLFACPGGMSGESPTPVVEQENLTTIPRVELPAKAADLVQYARGSERRLVTARLIRASTKISRELLPAVVGAISKRVPEMAATAAGEAAQEQPAQASAMAKTAAAAAPDQTKAIVLAVCRAAPDQWPAIALSVQQIVPGCTEEISVALASFFPELRRPIRTNSLPLSRTPAPGVNLGPAANPPKPDLVRSEISTRARDPLVRGPTVGPPFVPFSGTATNVTTSTSGTVPTGGRNYARP